MKTATIELTGMKFHAYHGCLAREKEKGNLFVVDFSCEYDVQEAIASDSLADTLDYGEIYDIIVREMAVPSNLLEHVAGRIVSAIHLAHPEIESFSVSVSKHNPPVAGEAEWSKVTVSHTGGPRPE